MVQKRETKAINKFCVREILSLSFVCGAYFFEFRGQNLVCFVIAYNFNGKFAPEAEKTRMRTAFFTRADFLMVIMACGIARGRVRPMTTTTTESRNMAAILQITG